MKTILVQQMLNIIKINNRICHTCQVVVNIKKN